MRSKEWRDKRKTGSYLEPITISSSMMKWEEVTRWQSNNTLKIGWLTKLMKMTKKEELNSILEKMKTLNLELKWEKLWNWNTIGWRTSTIKRENSFWMMFKDSLRTRKRLRIEIENSLRLKMKVWREKLKMKRPITETKCFRKNNKCRSTLMTLWDKKRPIKWKKICIMNRKSNLKTRVTNFLRNMSHATIVLVAEDFIHWEI